ncbi:hypothetical protein DDT91_15320 [Algoriphagus sp. AK58]|nr:hypothetical protein [Algoriphagus sp. AK58]
MGYALYDADSNLYEQGKVILSKKARNKHEELIQKLAIKKDGYIETYLVNETAENVWFDQYRIMSTGPLIVQETHYDPWGVDLSGLGYQYGGIKTNPYLYNGKELTSGLGVIMYDYGARFYIPAIGRWFVHDPLAEKARRHSPYNYALNNPMRFIDPDGMEAYSVMGGVVFDGYVGDDGNGNYIGGHKGDGSKEKKPKNEGSNSDATESQTNEAKNDNCPECINLNLDQFTVTAPRWWPGVLGRAADLWYAQNITNSTYGRDYGTGYTPQSQWYSDFRTFVGAGYGVINNMLMLPLSGAGYADEVLAAGGSIGSNGRVFWSGGNLAREAAENFALSTGGRTLEMTLQGRLLTRLTNLTSYNVTAPLWRWASSSFARNAQGSVNVFQNANTGVRLNSVWRTSEYPILRGNNNIIYHNVY